MGDFPGEVISDLPPQPFAEDCYCVDGCVLMGRHDKCVTVQNQYDEIMQRLSGYGPDEMPMAYRTSELCFRHHQQAMREMEVAALQSREQHMSPEDKMQELYDSGDSAQRAEVCADAARYRWLKEHHLQLGPDCWIRTGDDLDEAIDAEMRAHKATGEQT